MRRNGTLRKKPVVKSNVGRSKQKTFKEGCLDTSIIINYTIELVRENCNVMLVKRIFMLKFNDVL